MASRSPVRPELLAVSAQPRPARPVPRVVWARRIPVQRALLAVSARQQWVLRVASALREASVLPRPAELGQRHPARMEQLAA